MDFDASTPTYAHDANGNLTSDGVFSYAYDTANQLTNVVRTADGARVLSARYDALGRRVEATRADGSVERYVYFPGSFLVLAVLDGTNAVKEVYTRGPDLSGSLDGAGGIGGILAVTDSASVVRYSHADLMGNVIALTDASGSVAATFRYTPFGQLSARTGSVLSRYLFSSKEFDRAANLYYYGYRYYAPRLGQWMTRDPIEEAQSFSLYLFVGNNSLQGIDYLGLAYGNPIPTSISIPVKRQGEMDFSMPNKPEKCGECCVTSDNRLGHWECTQKIEIPEKTGNLVNYIYHNTIHKWFHEDSEQRPKTSKCWSMTYCFEEPKCEDGWESSRKIYYDLTTGKEAPQFKNSTCYHGEGAPDHKNLNSTRSCFEMESRNLLPWSHARMVLGRWCLKCVADN